MKEQSLVVPFLYREFWWIVTDRGVPESLNSQTARFLNVQSRLWNCYRSN